jgi:hypothetical protein
MSNGPNGNPAESERRSREPLSRSNLSVPTGRLILKPRTVVNAEAQARAESPGRGRHAVSSAPSGIRPSRPSCTCACSMSSTRITC